MGVINGLKTIHEESLVSFHMPGHKGGRLLEKYLGKSFLLEMDITEIPGSDNLHCPESHVLETMTHYKKLYGSDESYLLVNGSTVGILAAILSQTDRGDKIIVNRFAHKSIHNAILMNELNPIYIMPKTDNFGVIRGLADGWKTMIDINTDARVICMTYPTYEGTIYNLKEVIDYAHEKGMLVIVDEAHGAHFTFSDQMPKDALKLGADIIIQSLHKTLPAVTQTAVLHTKGCRYNHDALSFYLSALQSSSPSYMFLQSMDACAIIMKEQGRRLVDNIINRTNHLIDCINALGYDVLDNDDVTKVMISPNCLGITGTELEDTLRKEYAIQCEYSTDCFALLMVTVCNEEEDFNRLLSSLGDLKEKLSGRLPIEAMVFNSYRQPIVKRKPAELKNCQWETVKLDELEGRILHESVIPYPPGIPLIKGGEVVTLEYVTIIKHLREQGYKIMGVHDQALQEFRVVRTGV